MDSTKLHFFNYQLDLYADTASDWLTFDRNTWSAKGKNEIDKVVENNLKLWVERHKQQLLKNHRSELSALAKQHVDIQDNELRPFWKSLAHELSDDWQNLRCRVLLKGQDVQDDCYRRILQKNWTLTSSSGFSEHENFLSKPEKLAFVNEIEMALCVEAWFRESNHGVRYAFEKTLAKHFPTQRYLLELIEIETDEDRIQIAEVPDLMRAIEQVVRHVHWGTRRIFLPLNLLPQDWDLQRLILRDGTKVSGGKLAFQYSPGSISHVLLPYAITSGWRSKADISLDRMDEFFVWVHKNLATAIPLSEVKTIYAQLMAHIDEVVMKDSDMWQKYRAAA